MGFHDIVPTRNPKQYIPDALTMTTIPSTDVVLCAVDRITKSMNVEDYVGFATGAVEFHKINTHSDEIRASGQKIPMSENRTSWYPTDEIADVRVFFRISDNFDEEKTLGSKVRVYNTFARNRGDEETELQSNDTGFLNYNMYSKAPDMQWQNSLASTVLYQALFCVGGPATVRKLNRKNESENSMAATYREIVAVNPSYREGLDRWKYEHILEPAARAGGIDDPIEFLGFDFLDDVADALFESKDIEELSSRVQKAGDLGLTSEDMREVIRASNAYAGKVSRQMDKEKKHQGINVVELFRYIAREFE